MLQLMHPPASGKQQWQAQDRMDTLACNQMRGRMGTCTDYGRRDLVDLVRSF